MEKQTTNFSQQFIEKIIHDLFQPLCIMHAHNIVHRDISLSNILIKQENCDETVDIVLYDFDFEQVLRQDGVKTTSIANVTTRFVAPEVVTENDSKMMDVWSAGLLLVQLMTLEESFTFNLQNASEKQIRTLILKKLVS